MKIRQAETRDHATIFTMIDPVFKAGDTYAIDRDLNRDQTLAYWCALEKTVFVVEDKDTLLGTYYLVRNFGGGGSHVCNCGYITSEAARGKGVARTMLNHSLKTAKDAGFRAMMYNSVISTNIRAVQTWQRAGFEQVGRLPDAFNHPDHGYVDALVMFKTL